MSDPRLNPSWQGRKCPTCKERVATMWGDQCNYCNFEELKRARARIEGLEVRYQLALDRIAAFEAEQDPQIARDN